jgi:hypothetical protein
MKTWAAIKTSNSPQWMQCSFRAQSPGMRDVFSVRETSPIIFPLNTPRCVSLRAWKCSRQVRLDIRVTQAHDRPLQFLAKRKQYCAPNRWKNLK